MCSYLGDDWSLQLATIEYAHMGLVQRSTGLTPFEIDTGRQLSNPILPEDFPGNDFARQFAENRQRKAQKRQKKYYDKSRADVSFSVGDYALLATRDLPLRHASNTTDSSERPKLVPRYVGPFRVIGKIGANAYKLDLPPSMCRMHPVFNVDRLKASPGNPGRFQTRPVPKATPVVFEQDTGEQLYIIESLLETRQFNRKREYLVQWHGLPRHEASWERESNIKHISHWRQLVQDHNTQQKRQREQARLRAPVGHRQGTHRRNEARATQVAEWRSTQPGTMCTPTQSQRYTKSSVHAKETQAHYRCDDNRQVENGRHSGESVTTSVCSPSLQCDLTNYAAAIIAYVKYPNPGALSKLMGVTTDGAANMTGCAKGSNIILVDAAVAAGRTSCLYVVWCSLHRANLSVGKMLDVLDIDYQFRSKLSSVVAFVRKHRNLHASIGYAVTYSETRWNSISSTCSWMAKKCTEIVAFARTVGKENLMLEATWWLCLYAVETITDKICVAFKKMQYQTITPRGQLRILQDSLFTLLLLSQKQDMAEGENCFCDSKLEYINVGEDVDAWTTFQAATENDKATQLMTQHKMQLKTFGGADMLKAITRERGKLMLSYAGDMAVQKSVNSNKGATLKVAWANFVDKYPNLVTYCAGLATVLPATYTVESDFTVLKNTKDDNSCALSNYAMEGQMQAKQFQRISAAVTSAKVAYDRIWGSSPNFEL
ncbi:hypothetical protein ACHHYP_14367 [Achlya hypogyna]|uniref:Chromo domain-containing protein n=1 Tax=Achlya hypogyna TaxID=1202772 RepID=A0A1V9YD83_ACHHY|nr:hypothetical protein ACHHYP_14367 [Achlya hypogyna]